MRKILLFLILSINIFAYNRIASLTLGSDEMLLSLVKPSQIVALSGKIDENKDYSHIVNQSKQYDKVEANIEKLISLNPDFVIVADWMSKDTLEQIKEITPNLYIYKTPSSFDSLKQTILDLSKKVGNPNKGDELVKNIDSRIKKVQDRIKKRGSKKLKMILYTSYGTTAGQGSTFDDYIKKLNGINLASQVGIGKFDKISKEKLIELNPDVIIIPVSHEDKDFANFLLQDKSFENINAVKNNKIIVVPSSVTSPVSQYMVDGLEILANKVYGVSDDK